MKTFRSSRDLLRTVLQYASRMNALPSRQETIKKGGRKEKRVTEKGGREGGIDGEDSNF